MSTTPVSDDALEFPHISAVVISYNRAPFITAVLSALQFADEVLLIDKCSTDNTIELAAPLCDRVIQVPWTPTVEETRVEAFAQARFEWVLFLDDDEILNPEAVAWVQNELNNPRAEAYSFPRREYILGRHDPKAYYWPQSHIRLFRKGSVQFSGTVHAGVSVSPEKLFSIDPESGVAIEHLSHSDTRMWIEKTNRYTSVHDRERVPVTDEGLAEFAKSAIDKWISASDLSGEGEYVEAAAVLRATYDIIDRLKSWEETILLKGQETFEQIARKLQAAHEINLVSRTPRAGLVARIVSEDLRARTEQIENAAQALHEAEVSAHELRVAMERQQFQMLEIQAELLTVLNSTWWRVGEPFRLAGRRFPRLSRLVRKSAWGVGKAIFYYKKGILRERLVDLWRHEIAKRRARRTDLRKVFGLKLCTGAESDPGSINLPSALRPIVSIVIPTFGHVDFTLRCLASIALNPPVVPFEVLVVEDASGDPAVEFYKKVTGIRYISWKTNMGFLQSCNAAVKEAQGEYIFLLNNDTEIMRGAVDNIFDLLRRRPDIGLAGSRLIYPDGRLQEAGGIIWRDGSAWNYGRFDDPRKPAYSYVREVDYISGAAIMISKNLWNRLGGFDSHYSPAYCEDSDLAFRVRQVGLKVVYQPNSWVIHHEGVSHGTDLSAGLKSYQIQNGLKFYERWKDILAKQNYENGHNVIRARDRAFAKKIVLVIDHLVPEPDRDAGSRTIIMFLETLLAMGRVVKFWPSNGRDSPLYTEILQQMGIEVLVNPWESDFQKWISANGDQIDEVLLSRPTIAPMYLPDLRRHCRAPVIFYGHDLHFARMEIEAQTLQDVEKKNAAAEMKIHERRVWLSVDRVLYPSAAEVEIVKALEPSVHVSVVSPYAFKSVNTRTAVPPSNMDLLFVAGFRHSPNIDAALWFCQNVLPLIQASYPNVHLTLVGSHPSKAVVALSSASVTVTGFVTDEELAQRYGSARVVVAPMRFGAGVKMKVVEALREGAPLVTTSIGAQGLEDIASVVDICDGPRAFADAVIRLMTDDALWLSRSQAEASYVARHFTSECMRDGLEAAFTVRVPFQLESVA